MTIVSGIRSGLRSGIRSGLNPTDGPAADVDATSGKYIPSSAAQFTALGITAPQALWLPGNTTSGDIPDEIGALDLVAANTPLYQQSVTGWATKAVAGTVAGTNARFSVAGADISTTSICLLWYVHVTQCTDANLQFIEHGDARLQQVAGDVTTRVRNATQVGDTAGNHTGVVALMLMHDVTNNATKLFSNVEKKSITFAASTGTNLQISPAAAAETTGVFKFLWGCEWTGADAEISDATAKARLQALNWSIAWS